METAINIGKACQLLEQNMNICVVDGVEREQVQRSLRECISKSNSASGLGVVVTGDALIMIMLEKAFVEQLMLICSACKAVMCCRVSPKQKAEVVQMVR